MKYIDNEEKDFIESFERGDWKREPGRKKEMYIKDAKETLKKDKRINIRLAASDYHAIKIKAIEGGIPYQTLISSIIHKYNKGKLKQVD